MGGQRWRRGTTTSRLGTARRRSVINQLRGLAHWPSRSHATSWNPHRERGVMPPRCQWSGRSPVRRSCDLALSTILWLSGAACRR